MTTPSPKGLYIPERDRTAAPREIILAICTPIGRDPRTAYVHSMRRLITPLRKPGHPLFGTTHLLDVVEIPIEEARRQLTTLALGAAPAPTHLLFVDDDMVFNPDAALRLLRHDVPIVGGLCHNRRHPYQPILARKNAPEWGLADTHGFVYDYPRDVLFDVDATGGAFLLVKREVFEAIEAREPGGKWWIPRDGASEDFSFCARAKAAGFSVLVDTGTEIGHVGHVIVDADFARRNRRAQWQRHHPSVPRRASDATPLVSVIIPTFNQRPELLLAAVHSALAQTEPCEVIVVDDGTTDYVLVAATEDLVEGTRGAHDAREAALATGSKPLVRLPSGVRLVVHATNRGIGEALNTGFAMMKTDWFCWLSSDDLFEPEKVERQRAATVEAGAFASFHGYEVIVEGAEWGQSAVVPNFASHADQQRQLATACCINGSTTMIHRSVFAKVGGFDPNLRYGQDWEAWLRIGTHFRWLPLDDVLGVRREGGNLTQVIAAAPVNDERRQRRDEEDRAIRAAYAQVRCPHCHEAIE